MSAEESVWDRLKYDRDGIIEASAGTGKTYALQRIVRRLVRDAEHPVDPRNILLVTFTDKAAGELKDRMRDILSEDGRLPAGFDEMTICTIHSFCREILSEYAFENRVPMQMKICGSAGDIVHRAVRAALMGDEFRERYGAEYTALMESDGREGDGRAAKVATTEDLALAAEAVLDECARSGTPPEAPENGGAAKSGMLDGLVSLAWPVFRRLKDEAAVLTFDDLVAKAHQVIGCEAEREARGLRSALMESIRRRYRIALVDEFQDTNERQWTIFRSLFSSRVNRISGDDAPEPHRGFLIVVGDPKQSIYSFQGADVATYLAARREITGGEGAQKMLSLDRTYRSCEALVDSFGKMFGRESGWFEGMKAGGESIEYPDVGYPDGNERFLGLEDMTGRGAVTLLESLPWRLPDITDNRGSPGYGSTATCLPVFMRNAAREMKRLRSLRAAYRIADPKTGRKTECGIKYGDMCVLVRGEEGAKTVRRELAAAGIPYSHYKERGVYGSVEAEALVALFDFLAEPWRSGSLAALLMTPLFNIHPSEIAARLANGGAEASGLLERWQELSARRSWIALFESVMNDTELARPSPDDREYDRRRAAFRQMLDMLLAEKGRRAAGPGEFAALLRAWRRDDRAAGENGALRQKENESDSVQIMTMHASKGLEFKAVFVAAGFGAPRRGAGSEEEEEERRLYYVALTRAEHKLYLPWTKWDVHARTVRRKAVVERGLGSRGSPLLGDGFLSRAVRACFEKPEAVSLRECGGDAAGGAEAEREADTPAAAPAPKIYETGRLDHLRFRWDSFSSLSRGERTERAVPSVGTESDEASAGGISAKRPEASLLPRNNISGNVFHEIMETLCGTDEGTGGVGFAIGRRPLAEALDESGPLMELVRRAMRRNALSGLEGGGDSTERTLARMVWRALNTRIEIGERMMFLRDVAFENRLAEVEFAVDEASALGDDLPRIGGKVRDGAFNGKIDLLVRPDGRGGPVYVIDWKTNTLADYGRAGVEAAMEAAGYPLQFKLYSLAVARWLGRGAAAGVAYLFVRGGEHGEASGVYARVVDDEAFEDCRRSVLNAVANEGLAWRR